MQPRSRLKQAYDALTNQPESKTPDDSNLTTRINQTRDQQDLMLQFSVIQYLTCENADKAEWQKIIDAYLKNGANPQTKTSQFAALLQQHFKNLNTKIEWSAYELVCCITPNEENIQLAKKFVEHMKKNKIAFPEHSLSAMFNQLLYQEDFFLQGIFFYTLHPVIKKMAIYQQIEEVIHSNQHPILKSLINHNEKNAAFFICNLFARIDPIVILMPELLKKLNKKDLQKSSEETELFWTLVKKYPQQMNQFFNLHRAKFLETLSNPEFLKDKKEFTAKEAEGYLTKKDSRFFPPEPAEKPIMPAPQPALPLFEQKC